MKACLVVLMLLLTTPAVASAEWQIKPFVGVTFGGGTTFYDPEFAAGHPNVVFGASGMLLGEVFGIEADFGYAPGFFQRSSQGLALISGPTMDLVADSGVTTLTGNVVVALPRHLAEYTLRPYFVGGAGLMHVRIDRPLGLLNVDESLEAMDLGGGVTGFLSKRIGVSWDVRYFRSINRTVQSGLSFGSEQLSFWRANMAVAIKL